MKAYKEASNQNAKALIGDDIAREKEKLEELYTTRVGNVGQPWGTSPSPRTFTLSICNII
jgi:hypothetical protein